MVSERTAAIVAELQRRYPCQALPHGAQAELAQQFGVSHEWIRQVANKYGLTGRISTRTITVCGGCGKEMANKVRGICTACRRVELPCANCGKPKSVLASTLAARINASEKRAAAGQPVYTGRVYCDRKCYGQWFGRNHGIQTRPQDQYNRREPIAGT